MVHICICIYMHIYRVFKKNRHFSRCWYLLVIRTVTVNPFCFSYIPQKCKLWTNECYFLLRSCSFIVINWRINQISLFGPDFYRKKEWEVNYFFSITFKVTDNNYGLVFELYTHLKQSNVLILKITSANTKKCQESDIPMLTNLSVSVGCSKSMELVLCNFSLKTVSM